MGKNEGQWQVQVLKTEILVIRKRVVYRSPIRWIYQYNNYI